ncbi:DAK2 domain-containing protein [Hathewaya limosa]|uniref:DAK2 domain fusion protein YloV n=1 Tax=Hathewaya limosa TaxID=1536 RepID=A0ABU0JS44_HATLI|nr:DAK2 domain-containing protein [Hathewaya limosa]MDQ0479003.1 DAK2 domain fusion protein YloV [Hathewaya limosa]
MKYQKIDGHNFYNMIINASNKLGENKEHVNALNVFPVPDGDTGTNMWMTFSSAVEDIKGLKDESIGNIARVLARGALMGARGNSGVILSQILRGFAKGLEEKDEISKDDLARALEEGAKFAYKAVMRPTEGTILTIVRTAGEAAVNSNKTELCELFEEVIQNTEEMLNKTPEMLPQLKEAKVVDAGGYGLLLIIKGMYEALKFGVDVEVNKDFKETKVVENKAQSNIDVKDIKFGYCTEFFVLCNNVDVEAFKKDLEKYGDSMVVVGLEDIVKVHIHTNDPGLILSKALKLGELSKVKIDNMREQHRHLIYDEKEVDKNIEEQPKEEEQKKYAFISVARGEGIVSILEELGVDRIIEGGQTMNPSTQDILEKIESLNAEHIIVCPNNKNIIMAAKQAVDLTDKKVYVLPTKTIPEGITALTVFNEEDTIEENLQNMEEVIGNVSTGSVTYAIKDTEADGMQIKKDDILGLVQEKISQVGNNIYEVCENVLDKMVNEDSELITIYYGEDCEETKVKELVEKLEEKYEDLDIQCYEGKQPLYYFIVSVE